tara:strand:- start:2408 stop:6205 length:3798 start_codon:yes stop_codon:yes gene_type:complete
MEMNSTFFIVIAIVVVFLLLLLFFQTSCDNKNNEINSEPFEIKRDDLLLVDLGSSQERKLSCQKKLGECEGDCDHDSDCYNGMLCYQRSLSSDKVPGCKIGGKGDDPTHDYCYHPSRETKAILYIQVDDASTIKVYFPNKPIKKYTTNGWNKMHTFEFPNDFSKIEVIAVNSGGGPGGLIARIDIPGEGVFGTTETCNKYIKVKKGDSIMVPKGYSSWSSNTHSKLKGSKWIRDDSGGTYTLNVEGRPPLPETKKKILPKVNSNKDKDLLGFMEGSDRTGDTFQDSNNKSLTELGILDKIKNNTANAQFGLYRYETDNINIENENQNLNSIGNVVDVETITKGYTKQKKYIRWIGYIYVKDPATYRFFLYGNNTTLKISDKLSTQEVKTIFNIDKDQTNCDTDQHQMTIGDESRNAKKTLIDLKKPNSHYRYQGRSIPTNSPLSKNISLEHGIFRFEIISSSNDPIEFYYTNKNDYLNSSIHKTNRSSHRYCKSRWLGSCVDWDTRYKYWTTFEKFHALKKNLKKITSETKVPLVFFNFGTTNKNCFPNSTVPNVNLNYDSFQNTSPISQIKDLYEIQKNGQKINIKFNDEFLIEFDIRVTGKVSGWSNIFRITRKNGSNLSHLLDRIVALWLHGSKTKIHLRTANNVNRNFGDDNKINYDFTLGTLTRVSIFTKYVNGEDRLLTFIAQQFDNKGNKIGNRYEQSLNIGRNPDANGKDLELYISDKFYNPSKAELSNFTFSTNIGGSKINYIRRIAQLKYYSINQNNFNISQNTTINKDTAIISSGVMPKNFVFQISISDLIGDSGELFSINKRPKNNQMSPILALQEPIMTLKKNSANEFSLIWNKFSEKSEIPFIIKNKSQQQNLKFIILVADSKLSIFQDVDLNNYVGLVMGHPINNGLIIEDKSLKTNTNIFLCGPAFNNNNNKIGSFKFNSIPKFLTYNKENNQFKYLDPTFSCESLTKKDECGPNGTISARLNEECHWYNPNSIINLNKNLKLGDGSEMMQYKKKHGDSSKCINKVEDNQCFMQDPMKEGECQDSGCIIHPHESGDLICLSRYDKPKVELESTNRFNFNVEEKIPQLTKVVLENPDKSKISDVSEQLISLEVKNQEIENEVSNLKDSIIPTNEAFINYPGNNINKIQSINQATTIYASPVENNETSFKLHVNGKCVTVYDKDKLLLTDCNDNLVGQGFKNNKVSNNLVAKVESGVEPIMTDDYYPYPYEMIKSNLTSQCLNIDLKNNLTMQKCNPDKVDQFFRSHYTQK